MNDSPHSSATRTLARASSRVTARNSWPSDEAPKLRMGRCSPVLPSGRVFISTNKQWLQVAEVNVLGHIFSDNCLVRNQQVGIARAGFGSDFERDVQKLPKVRIEFR